MNRCDVEKAININKIYFQFYFVLDTEKQDRLSPMENIVSTFFLEKFTLYLDNQVLSYGTPTFYYVYDNFGQLFESQAFILYIEYCFSYLLLRICYFRDNALNHHRFYIDYEILSFLYLSFIAYKDVFISMLQII